jgi:hypothetical protein
MRVSRTVLRGALGETPEVYSPARPAQTTLAMRVPVGAENMGRHCFYGACTEPGTHEIFFFADSVYFQGARF